jgi:hypothetical protein
VSVSICTQPTNIIEADGCEDAAHAEKLGKSNFAFGKTKLHNPTKRTTEFRAL